MIQDFNAKLASMQFLATLKPNFNFSFGRLPPTLIDFLKSYRRAAPGYSLQLGGVWRFVFNSG
jgi:hypothetical protein